MTTLTLFMFRARHSMRIYLSLLPSCLAVLLLGSSASANADLLTVNDVRTLPSDCTKGTVAYLALENELLQCRAESWVPASWPRCAAPGTALTSCADGEVCWDDTTAVPAICRAERWCHAPNLATPAQRVAISGPMVACGNRPCVGRIGPGRVTIEIRKKRGPYLARNQRKGKPLYRGPDAGAAIQAAIDHLSASGGDIVLRRGLYEYDRIVPTLPSGLVRWIRIIGNGATVRLSDDAPRAFDVTRQADYDNFRYLWIEGISVDAANIATANHILFGNRVDRPEFSQRIGYSWIVLRNLRVFNGHTSGDAWEAARAGIALVTRHLASDEAVISRIENVLIDRVTLEGGNNGVLIVGTALDGSSTPAIELHNVRITGSRHVLGNRSFGRFASSNFHIGSYAKVGYVSFFGNEGEGAGDNGLEINNFDAALVRGNRMRDQANISFFATNFRTAEAPDRQFALFADNASQITHQPSAYWGGRGYVLYSSDDHPALGTVAFLHNEYDCTAPEPLTSALMVYGGAQSILVDDFRARFDSALAEGAPVAWQNPFVFNSTLPSATLTLRNVSIDYRVRVPASAAGKSPALGVFLFNISGERLALDLQNIVVSVAADNRANPEDLRIRYLMLGDSPYLPSGRSRLNGSIRRFVVAAAPDMADLIGIELRPLLSADPTLVFSEIDMSRLPTGSVPLQCTQCTLEALTALCADGQPLDTSCMAFSP